jgi:hypothetical protein
MGKSVDQLIIALDAVRRSMTPTTWRRSTPLVETFQSPEAEKAVGAMLRVFERFPTGDSHGVFWSILHGLEAHSGRYEFQLIESVRRAPAEFSLIMLNRMINAGETELAGESLCPS